MGTHPLYIDVRPTSPPITFSPETSQTFKTAVPESKNGCPVRAVAIVFGFRGSDQELDSGKTSSPKPLQKRLILPSSTSPGWHHAFV